MQLFWVLCIYSEGKIEDKARFLYDMFNFNSEQSILPLNFEFMLTNWAHGIWKLYNIQTEIQQDNQSGVIKELQDLVKESYLEDAEITLKEVIEWGKSDSLGGFLEYKPNLDVAV